ncbi:M23 family metallopeptidase [Sagittula salina]|uniref:LysM peptidoglycan-binding domain-containing M23 family metallopeptidase n=1 Tax=Sagittula salina TaxID=2820268 RepID=A0A940MJW4_9RHOB|nr:M23 family metallopeptidase [Sagittula salina]MBP0480958.1 LysM peptidoglycan-binding domain-containing M23 family metallopeptidase [Sagittula salina]
MTPQSSAPAARRLTPTLHRSLSALALMAALGACTGMDVDMRGRMGGPVDTSAAAAQATGTRPAPDDRGLISYPSYQVAVARRGDTVATVATRVGLPAQELARYNGLQVTDPLNRGEIVALPRRVSEPSPATGATTTGPLTPATTVDVATLAGNAIDRSPATSRTTTTAAAQGVEPIRHQVTRGETAFSVARLYNVSPRSLAEWNGLDRDFTIREGQFLLIPPTVGTASAQADSVTQPGAVSPLPTPPSAATPLPAVDEKPLTPAPITDTATPTPAPKPAPVADIGQKQTKPAATTSVGMMMPVDGKIIRDYAPGKNNSVVIGASPGTPVKAAASGTVIHAGTSASGLTFVLLKHPDNMNTAYANISDIAVKKGDAVSKGQTIARIAAGESGSLEFRVLRGSESVDPMNYVK